MQFKKVLLPVDINDPDSWEKTIPTCIDILKDNPSAQIYCLAVIPNFGLSGVEEYFPKGWLKDVSAKTLADLESIVYKHFTDDVKPNLLVEKGVVYQVILDKATELEIDLIIMSASHPKSKNFLLGPNAARVARHAEISVLIRR